MTCFLVVVTAGSVSEEKSDVCTEFYWIPLHRLAFLFLNINHRLSSCGKPILDVLSIALSKSFSRMFKFISIHLQQRSRSMRDGNRA